MIGWRIPFGNCSVFDHNSAWCSPSVANGMRAERQWMRSVTMLSEHNPLTETLFDRQRDICVTPWISCGLVSFGTLFGESPIFKESASHTNDSALCN
ncbi:MAG: hypothetical protein JWM11_508 [Planctomycetaceae bacterium]|nr:hypothetical protein [Planctomycetaceae bacterium]